MNGLSLKRALRLLPAACLLAATPAAAIPCLSGFVRDAEGRAVAGADLDFTIAATGTRIITPGDNTDLTGFYAVCVLPNVYDVTFAPPAGTRLLGQLLRRVDLSTDPGLELDVTLDSGQVVSGVVRDSGGFPVADVDLDVDRVSGGRLYTPDDNTDLTGAFRVVVPAGEHRFRFETPRGSRWRGAEIDSVDTTSDVSLEVTLAEGFLLQGLLTDDGGAPVADVEVDLRESLTGAKVYLANNASDAGGNFVVAAPGGDFELRFTPPRGANLVAVSHRGLILAGDTIRNETLARGHRVSVTVTGTGGVPLTGADLDVKVTATGAKLFTPHDRADGEGTAVAVVPGGIYDLIIDPPVGASYAGAVLPAVVVNEDLSLSVVLDGAPRVTVSGRVVDPWQVGIADAAFAARLSATGQEIRLANGRTAPDGSFVLDLPPVRLDLTIAPPFGSRLVGRRLPGVIARQDTTWSDLALTEGRWVSITVTGTHGRLLAGVDIDFVNEESGAEIFTPSDDTGADGTVVVTVPPGVYRVQATPPPGSGFAVGTLRGVGVVSDQSLSIALPVIGGIATPVAVLPAQPNPARGAASFGFRLTAPTAIDLAVFDLRGRFVRTLRTGSYREGQHEAIWDGRDQAGARAPAGIYFLKLRTPLGDAIGRLTLLH